MKIRFFSIFLLFGIIAGCQSQQKFEEVDAAEVDQAKLEMAANLTENLLSEQKKGGFYELTAEEATSAMISGLGERRQKKSYKQIKKMFGDYKSIRFNHMMRSTTGAYLEIYRFKGDFDQSENELEVRAVFDADQKLAGFFVRPWTTQF
ncbi:MAG: hypothetical protein WBM43_01945 [Flavobacteriaceae bacterium]